MFQYFQIFFYMLLTVLQLLADWPASLMKTIFKSHKIFFAVVQIFLYIDVDGNYFIAENWCKVISFVA